MKKRTWVVLAVLAGVVAWLALRKKKTTAPPGTVAPVGITSVGDITVTDWNPPPTPPGDARFIVAL